jgi:putative oxygen-independent coproporphyrinogen III oxidase
MRSVSSLLPASGEIMAAPAPERLFGIYVHWPFCLSKCPYCDFNSHVRERVEQARWRTALLRELAHFARRTEGRTVTSIFFGGGTPSLMPVETVGAVIEAVRNHWLVTPDLEITLEANPTSVEAEKFAGLRAAGVNRVSLGVQALDDAALRFLGRMHSHEEALEAVALAGTTFPRFSFDLIYGRPGQTPDAWAAELGRALGFAADHLSLYQLTIERGTRFFQDHRRGAFVMPDEDTAARLFEDTQAMLADAGLPPYEISNHARPGAECRHNLTYWHYEDYVGIGPGAHGRFTADPASAAAGKRAVRATSGPEAWLEQVEASGAGTAEDRLVQAQEAAGEALMMGLRLVQGIDRARFRRVTGADPVDAVAPRALEALVANGFLAVDAERLAATAAGRQRLNAVLERLLA